MEDFRLKNRQNICQTLTFSLDKQALSEAKYIRKLESELAEMKQVEQDLKRLAIVVKDSNDAITLQDFDGNILSWNRGAERIYGYSEKEALNMNIYQIVPTEKHIEMADFMRKLEKGNFVESFETQRLSKDGTVLDVWLTVTPIVDEVGNVSMIATTERDITERKKKEKEKEEMIVELQNALSEVKSLRGLLPICASCKKVRDTKGYWQQIETYIREHSDADFSHGICPDCAENLYPDIFANEKM